MCYSQSRESLICVSLAGINRGLRRRSLSLNKLDQAHPTEGDIFTSSFEFTKSEGRGWYKEEVVYRVEARLRRDKGSLFLDIFPPYRVGEGSLCREGRDFSSFRLVKAPSNLKPGTARYYFKDPYSPPSEAPTLCGKVYYILGVGEFVSPSVLKSYGVLYSQQRQGHTARYYFPSAPLPPTRYRKKHYRGIPTPFWSRRSEREEERYLRSMEWEIANGLGDGLFPPEQIREIKEAYCRRVGRKTLPKGIYCTP